jgi:hypothetical protein
MLEGSCYYPNHTERSGDAEISGPDPKVSITPSIGIGLTQLIRVHFFLETFCLCELVATWGGTLCVRFCTTDGKQKATRLCFEVQGAVIKELRGSFVAGLKIKRLSINVSECNKKHDCNFGSCTFSWVFSKTAFMKLDVSVIR